MLGIKKAADPGRTDRIRGIRAWTREQLALGEDVTVMVTELTCSEPGCPPVETVIAVLEGKGRNRQGKVPIALSAVTREHVAGLQFVAVAEPATNHGTGGTTR